MVVFRPCIYELYDHPGPSENSSRWDGQPWSPEEPHVEQRPGHTSHMSDACPIGQIPPRSIYRGPGLVSTYGECASAHVPCWQHWRWRPSALDLPNPIHGEHDRPREADRAQSQGAEHPGPSAQVFTER
jgi:hypothetical protein